MSNSRITTKGTIVMAGPPKRTESRCPTHPGAFLREIVLPALPLAKAELARTLGISRQSLYDILGERQPVTPAMAVRLGAVFETSAASWLNMQAAYDLWHAKHEVDTSKLKPLKLAG
jgi:addiction module HigA family antidote